MNYPSLIKTIRETLLVTQAELAQMIGVSFATVNRWENGHFEPSIRQKRMIRQICQKNHIHYE